MAAPTPSHQLDVLRKQNQEIDIFRKFLQLSIMKTFTAVVEKCSKTGLYVGYIPGFAGAHSQGDTLDELRKNLEEVISMLMEEGEPVIEGEFIGTQLVTV